MIRFSVIRSAQSTCHANSIKKMAFSAALADGFNFQACTKNTQTVTELSTQYDITVHFF